MRVRKVNGGWVGRQATGYPTGPQQKRPVLRSLTGLQGRPVVSCHYMRTSLLPLAHPPQQIDESRLLHTASPPCYLFACNPRYAPTANQRNGLFTRRSYHGCFSASSARAAATLSAMASSRHSSRSTCSRRSRTSYLTSAAEMLSASAGVRITAESEDVVSEGLAG